MRFWISQEIIAVCCEQCEYFIQFKYHIVQKKFIFILFQNFFNNEVKNLYKVNAFLPVPFSASVQLVIWKSFNSVWRLLCQLL